MTIRSSHAKTPRKHPDAARPESSPTHQQQNGKPLLPPVKSQTVDGCEATPPQQVRRRTPAATAFNFKQHNDSSNYKKNKQGYTYP
ncbi:hypothetical protein Trydic_g16637 [Trypoxylus dichotomus]